MPLAIHRPCVLETYSRSEITYGWNEATVVRNVKCALVCFLLGCHHSFESDWYKNMPMLVNQLNPVKMCMDIQDDGATNGLCIQFLYRNAVKACWAKKYIYLQTQNPLKPAIKCHQAKSLRKGLTHSFLRQPDWISSIPRWQICRSHIFLSDWKPWTHIYTFHFWHTSIFFFISRSHIPGYMRDIRRPFGLEKHLLQWLLLVSLKKFQNKSP